MEEWNAIVVTAGRHCLAVDKKPTRKEGGCAKNRLEVDLQADQDIFVEISMPKTSFGKSKPVRVEGPTVAADFARSWALPEPLINPAFRQTRNCAPIAGDGSLPDEATPTPENEGRDRR